MTSGNSLLCLFCKISSQTFIINFIFFFSRFINSLFEIAHDFFKIKNNNIHLIGDAFFAFPPSFAQGASQSIEGAYELFKSIENNLEGDFFKNRVSKTKMVNKRSKLNQFAFHLSNPVAVLLRNIFLKKQIFSLKLH